MTSHDLAVCVAPYQVPRRADLDTLRRGLALAPEVLVAIAGAHQARSPRHPFTWQDRAAMIRSALSAEEAARVRFHPLREWWDTERATADLRHAAGAASKVLLLQLDTPRCEPPPGWQCVPPQVPDAPPEDALRERLFTGGSPDEALAALQPHLPPPVLDAFSNWMRSPAYPTLREEQAQIAREKAAWSVAPYPVVLVTVDAVVRAGDRVLLIRRGRMPGKGLRALPGGFLEVAETVLASALRELVEETRLPLSPAESRAALRGVQVFDAPDRSQRGRVITHAHYFDLGTRALPPVSGADDAAAAEWVPIAELAALEDQFLDDHFHILDHFLQLLPPP